MTRSIQCLNNEFYLFVLEAVTLKVNNRTTPPYFFDNGAMIGYKCPKRLTAAAVSTTQS